MIVRDHSCPIDPSRSKLINIVNYRYYTIALCRLALNNEMIINYEKPINFMHPCKFLMLFDRHCKNAYDIYNLIRLYLENLTISNVILIFKQTHLLVSTLHYLSMYKAKCTNLLLLDLCMLH